MTSFPQTAGTQNGFLDAGRIAIATGSVSLLLILGALGFQYIGHYPPCELCMWQRYPHFASIAFGLVGGGLVAAGSLDRRAGTVFAILAILAIATTGAIGVYHAGVEWHWWQGPTTCTGSAFRTNGLLDLNAPVVMCDHAAWRLFGISMAGYNAIISLGAAIVATLALMRRKT